MHSVKNKREFEYSTSHLQSSFCGSVVSNHKVENLKTFVVYDKS